MSEITIANINRPKSIERLAEFFEKNNPDFKIGTETVVLGTKERVELKTEYGGTRYIWIIEGKGEVYISEGYRTQEGDGEKLPSTYEVEPIDRDVTSALRVLKKKLNLISEEVPYGDTIRSCVKSILDRYKNGVFK